MVAVSVLSPVFFGCCVPETVVVVEVVVVVLSQARWIDGEAQLCFG